MNQSEFLAIVCNLLKTREKSCVLGAIGLGMASHWLKNLREIFKPINKRSDRNRVSPLYSHLKTVPDIMGVHRLYLLYTIRIDCVVIGRKNYFGIDCSTVT